MRRALLWGILVLASLLVVWVVTPEQIKASAYRAVMAQLLIRPNICMESNWEREALGFGRFHVAATEEWNGDVLILYNATCSDAQGQPQPVIGYHVFPPTPGRWVGLGGVRIEAVAAGVEPGSGRSGHRCLSGSALKPRLERWGRSEAAPEVEPIEPGMASVAVNDDTVVRVV